MGKQSYASQEQMCVTCAYWQGKRKLHKNGEYVKVDHAYVDGKCDCDGGCYRNYMRFVDFPACPSYRKWDLLE